MKSKTMLPILMLLIFLVGCTPMTAFSTLSLPVTVDQPSQVVHSVQPIEYGITSEDRDLLSSMQNIFQQIYANVNVSVVNISVMVNVGPGMSSGEGSGFVWDTQGHIVTNNHVVENASQISVTFSDGTVVDARLVGADPESDLAVIQVDSDSVELHPIILGDSQAVKVGDLAIAIGNPYGLSGTMTQGIVSALSRSLPVDETDGYSNGNYTIPDIIQTDAAINPGNSGGVLVNIAGEVIGVTSAIQSSTNSNSGIGFVIPAHIVQRVMPVLITDGAYAHPRMGISGTTLTPALADEMGLDADQRGVLVVSVSPNSPADQAGLRGTSQRRNVSGRVSVDGGDIITAVDGKALKTFEELISYVFNETVVGQTISLTVLRDGREQTIELTLGTLTS
jgi:S1-C subfamily serine protease